MLTEHGKEFLRQYKEHKERYIGAWKMLETLDCEREKLDSMCGTSLTSTISHSSGFCDLKLRMAIIMNMQI